MSWLRALLITLALLGSWQGVVVVFDTPHYILPGPQRVLQVWIDNAALIGEHAATTILEIVLGLALGALALRSGSVLPGVLLHLLHNGFALVAQLYLDESLLLMPEMWLLLLGPGAALVVLMKPRSYQKFREPNL